MRTAIFDLDGTLVDTSGDMLAAANLTFEELGHGSPLSVERHAATAFAGGRAMLNKGAEIRGFDWAPGALDQAYVRFLEVYSDHLDVFSQIYADVVPALVALKSAGWRLTVCTNKPEALAERLLVSLGLRDHFGALIGADTLAVRKPDPLPLEEAARRAGGGLAGAVMIGDTITDREAARRAGVPCVLVTFGPIGHGVADMEPEGLLDSFSDLEPVLHSVLEK